ncbi:MAG: S1 RNA-binding domain-containing protein, partial [Cyclobacteriaceae bacterium]
MTKPKGDTKAKAKPETDELKPVAKKAHKGELEIEIDEEDELAEFKKAKKAEEEGEETARIISNVADRKSTTVSPVSLESFDWDAFDRKGFGEGYSQKDREDLTNMYSGTVTSVNESEVVEGIVVGINDKDVILNIGFKSDGLVPVAEFKDLPNLKIGDKVDLFIEERENAMGQLVLSRRKAK